MDNFAFRVQTCVNYFLGTAVYIHRTFTKKKTIGQIIRIFLFNLF